MCLDQKMFQLCAIEVVQVRVDVFENEEKVAEDV